MEELLRTFWEHFPIFVRGPFERQEVNQIVSDLGDIELCDMLNTVVKAGERFAPVSDAVALEEPTVPLHNKRPIGPNQTGGLNPISNVEQGMDCYWAGRNPLWVSLVEDPVVNVREVGFFQRE